jgi:hypothetical protein
VIRACGDLLNLPQRSLATALVYCQRAIASQDIKDRDIENEVGYRPV